MSKLLFVPRTADPRRLAVENALRRWWGVPRLCRFEEVLAMMPPPGQSPRPEDLQDWLRHPDDRVVVDALHRYPGSIDRDRWSWVIRGAAATASCLEASWTWRLDRVWHAAELYRPDVLREVQSARISLETALRCLGPRRTRMALSLFRASAVREGVALYSRHVAVVRELLGHPACPNDWHLILANAHVCSALSYEVRSSAVAWLADLPTSLMTYRTLWPGQATDATPEIHRAIDILEKDPRLGECTPAGLGPALAHGDTAARERIAAMLCRLGNLGEGAGGGHTASESTAGRRK